MGKQALLPDEELTNLGAGLKIIQKKDGFRFGTDSVLLSRFASVYPSERVVDLGAGSAVICFMLWQKSREARYTAVEIQRDIADMAKRSVAISELGGSIEVINEDMRSFALGVNQGKFDVAVSNPPYRAQNVSIESSNDRRRLARCEVNGTLLEIISSAARLLCFGGRFYVVYRPQRLCDLLCAMREKAIEPKRLQFVHPRLDLAPSLVLVEGRKGAGVEINVEPPIVLEGDKCE